VVPGFFNAIRVYGAEGDSCTITVRESPGGPVKAEKVSDLFAQAAGFYELLFTVLPAVEQVGIDDIPLAPGAEVTVKVDAAGEAPVAVGDIKMGDWRNLVGDGDWGGTVSAQSTRNVRTLRTYAPDGSYAQVIRPGSRDVSCTIELPGDEAMYVDAVLNEIANVAVPFEASGLPRYGYLNTLGFVTGSISPTGFVMATLNLNVKGNI
jgi:hypothetical protein